MKPTAAIEKRAARSESVSTLTPAASKLAGASLAENTRRAYQSALNRIQGYLQEQGQDLTALDDSQLAEYLTALHESGSSPASATLACAAVRFLAKATGQPSPVGALSGRVLAGIRRQGKDRGRGQVQGLQWSQADTAAVRFLAKATGQPSPVGALSGRVLAGIRRQGKDRGRGQVQGLQWSQADTAAALASSGGQDLAGLRDAALIALMSDCLLRVSEAVALEVDDLQIETNGTGRLTVRQSKTDQEGAGAVLFAGAPTISRVRAWMKAAAIESGPLFRRVRRWGIVGNAPLSTQAVRSIIKRRATAADLQGRFSGH